MWVAMIWKKNIVITHETNPLEQGSRWTTSQSWCKSSQSLVQLTLLDLIIKISILYSFESFDCVIWRCIFWQEAALWYIKGYISLDTTSEWDEL